MRGVRQGKAAAIRLRSSRGGRALSIVLLTALGACGGSEGVSGPPDGGGDDLRPGLTVTVELDSDAAAIGQQLGWTAGVPGAEVRIHRIGTAFAWETATTDADGVARFEDAIAGRYRVAAHRPLNEQEQSAVGAAALALGDGVLRNVATNAEATLHQTPDRRGSLVISEVYATTPFTAETRYDWHYYFELYNNSDQTVYLDRKIWGTNLGIPDKEFSTFSCSASEPWRNDPDGIWAHFLHRFPGGGTDHPLAPGDFAVVALDAVDHSSIDPRFPDLSGADFELLGSADVDNPDVPNLPEVGVEPFQLGHGLRFFIGHVFFIAEDLNVAALERGTLTTISGDIEYLKLPAEALIDVLDTEDDDALEEQEFPPCDGKVHRSFDRLGGGFVEHGGDLEFSVQRMVIGADGGRVILQDTNTGAVDLIRARHTPELPPP